tara:strand:+ start:4505 stop:4717 length:213 start_codon:yes stop_codon:yes gene_type:complete
MKKLMISLGVLAFTACAPTAQLVYEKGNTTREALIYEDRVVVVTKTTVTKEQFEEAMEKRKSVATNNKLN